jgi:hypothetical protein
MDVLTEIKTKRTKRTKTELRLYLKARSKLYYASPEAKEAQRLKCIEYRGRTVDKRNARRRYLAKVGRLEKSLKRVWTTKGLIKDV